MAESVTHFNYEDESVTMNGKHYTKEEYEALNSSVFEHLEKARTIYTVPLHVGVNVEVPNYCKVTYYDPNRKQ